MGMESNKEQMMGRKRDHDVEYYFTYMTINVVTGKAYIGAHSTNDIDDGYVGSGQGILDDIKRYGKDSFKVISRWFHCNQDEAMLHEERLITTPMIKSDRWYNRMTGGYAGSYIASEETRDKMRQNMIGSTPWNKGMKIGVRADTLERHNKYYSNPKLCKMCENPISYKMRNKRTYCSNKCAHSDPENPVKHAVIEHKPNSGSFKKGHKISDETALKISKSLSGIKRERVECPHCGKIGDISLMKRWHFDKCKELSKC